MRITYLGDRNNDFLTDNVCDPLSTPNYSILTLKELKSLLWGRKEGLQFQINVFWWINAIFMNCFTVEIVQSTHREVGPLVQYLCVPLCCVGILVLNLWWDGCGFFSGCALLICLCLLQESPRYLAASVRKKAAMEALQPMVKVNKLRCLFLITWR